MDGMEAVVDAVDVDQSVDIDVDSQSSVDTQQDSTVDQVDADPYAPKGSREYSAWLKEQKERLGDDPNSAKFLRLSKDNHARLYQLQQMEPRGIDGVREKYAVLDSVVHGELKGIEALGAIQDELRGVQEIDERLFSGDAEALKEMGDEFVQQALPKLAGPILDMVRESNPEAYNAAVLPHFVEALRGSELVANFNGLVDVLNEAPPGWLTADQKAQWTEDRLKRVMDKAAKMGGWFNAQQAKAGELPKTNGNGRVTPTKEASELETLRSEGEKLHWSTNITPKLDAHADTRFTELFKPYARRLNLGKEQMDDLKSAFIGHGPREGRPGTGVIGKAMANKTYADQINRYHQQKRADPSAVINLSKVEFDKHAKTVMDGLVNTRYKNFLNGGQKTAAPTNGRPGVKPVSPGVQLVTVKPTNIDHKNTPLEWLHQKKYRLTDGKVVQMQG